MTVGTAGAAQRLGISKSAVERLVRDGELKEVSKGQISLDSVYAYSGLGTTAKKTRNKGGRPPAVLNAPEAAELLGIDVEEVNRLVTSGQLEIIIGAEGKRGIRKSDVMAHMAKPKEKKEEDAVSKNEILEETMTVKEAVEKTGLAESTLYYHMKKGTLRKVGTRLDAKSVEAFINEHGVKKEEAKPAEPNTRKIEPEEAKQLQEDIDSGKLKVKAIDDVADTDVGDTGMSEEEERFWKAAEEYISQPRTYTTEEVREAVDEAYKRGRLSVYDEMASFTRRTA